MYKVFIQTATIDDVGGSTAHAPAVDPGTTATVFLVLVDEDGDSDPLRIVGTTGVVSASWLTVDGQAQALADDGTTADVLTPFSAGVTAVVEIDPKPPTISASLKSIRIWHESDEAAWFPLSVRIEDVENGVVYSAVVNDWLVGADEAARTATLELKPDLTSRDGESSGVDTLRSELNLDVVPIGRNNGVRFEFNDDVDQTVFDPSRLGARARSLSIRYMSRPDGSDIGPEIRATVTGPETWTEDPEHRITAPGRYVWERPNVLLIGPPEGGWELGRFVRFELDHSLADTSGNTMVGDRDQVVIALVASEIELTISAPVDDVSYEPWQSDDALGDHDDFYISVSGVVTQRGADEPIETLHVLATNDNGTVLDLLYAIPITEVGHNELFDHAGNPIVADGTTDGGTSWAPDNAQGGKWTIHYPLQSATFTGVGAQAVAEKRYKWTFTAVARPATRAFPGFSGVEVPSTNSKVVYHEIYKPRVTSVVMVGPGKSTEVYRHDAGQQPDRASIRLNRRDIGQRTFDVELTGDYENSASFSASCTYDPTWEEQSTFADIQESDEAIQGNERANVSLPMLDIDDRSVKRPNGQPLNDSTHSVTFRARTKAGSRVALNIQFEVDTIALDLTNVQSVSLADLG